MDRQDAVLEPGVLDAPPVLVGADPEVGCPDREIELPGEEDRARRPAAAEIEHAHPGPQAHGPGEPLGQPEHVRAHDVLQDPARIIARGARELGPREPGSEIVLWSARDQRTSNTLHLARRLT